MMVVYVLICKRDVDNLLDQGAKKVKKAKFNHLNIRQAQ
jgi:hypothetical protein